MTNELGTPALHLEREGSIAWCTIDRPHARNALTPGMYYGIKRAVAIVNQDPDLAALIITGTGDVFAPGGDLGGRSEEGETTPDVIGTDVLPITSGVVSPSSERPPRSPPGANTSPVPVRISAARSGSELTSATARLIP